MKKTFKQLTVGDNIYIATEGEVSFKTETVSYVENNLLKYAYGSQLQRHDSVSVFITNSYSRNSYCFTSQADAIRYCKAQMMKHLFDLIHSAKCRIKEVQEFRAKNLELLNHEWTESQINILERSIR